MAGSTQLHLDELLQGIEAVRDFWRVDERPGQQLPPHDSLIASLRGVQLDGLLVFEVQRPDYFGRFFAFLTVE